MFLQLMKVIRPNGTVEEILECVSLQWTTGNKMDHRVGRDTGALKNEDVSAEGWFPMESLETLKGSVKVCGTDHAVETFLERIPWPLRRFYVNLSCKDG